MGNSRMPVARQLALLLLALQTVWAGSFPLRILSWNVHWQCGSDHIPDCRARAIQRFVALAAQHHASMVVSIELEANDTTPIDLPSHGLTGWVQYNGSCPGPSPTQSGDVAAVTLAPGFRILRAGGGCMGDSPPRLHYCQRRLECTCFVAHTIMANCAPIVAAARQHKLTDYACCS